MSETLRGHWPEYLMEAWSLGTFLVSAGLVVSLLQYPGSPVHAMLPDGDLRRALVGLAMGLTAVGIIYSPWGQRSGAQINAAVTLAFLRLSKIAPLGALFYILAEFIGGTLGIPLVLAVPGEVFSLPPVDHVATVPGTQGPAVAFAAEFAISLGLMLTVLFFMNSQRLNRLAGLVGVIRPMKYLQVSEMRRCTSTRRGSSWKNISRGAGAGP